MRRPHHTCRRAGSWRDMTTPPVEYLSTCLPVSLLQRSDDDSHDDHLRPVGLRRSPVCCPQSTRTVEQRAHCCTFTIPRRRLTRLRVCVDYMYQHLFISLWWPVNCPPRRGGWLRPGKKNIIVFRSSSRVGQDEYSRSLFSLNTKIVILPKQPRARAVTCG